MKKVICVDFDGTCVTHEYPEVGRDLPFAVETLKLLADRGNHLILWTMRSGEYLQQALDWFAKHEIPLFGVNENPEQKEWTDSPKAYGQIYIDDAAIGCPLMPALGGGRPYVDWIGVAELLEERGALAKEDV